MSNKININISEDSQESIAMFLDNIHTYIYTLKYFNDSMLNIFKNMDNLDIDTLLLLQNCKFIEQNVDSVIRNKDMLYEHLSGLKIIKED